jgi:outer membrane receptor for ferrienterochelin and colicins
MGSRNKPWLIVWGADSKGLADPVAFSERVIMQTIKIARPAWRMLPASLAILALHALAADNMPVNEDLAVFYGGEENVSIATGTSKPLRLAPAVASVITAKDIKEIGATTLDEALALVPGLYDGISAFNRLNPNWSIRGISTDQTPQVLLLRDGVPITHFYNGARPNLFYLPVEGIERIEVIRGPGSAIYGADAFAGVINVITKKPAEMTGASAGIRAGSFKRRDAWGQYGGNLGQWGVGLDVEYAHTDGDTSRVVGSDLQSVFDGVFGTHASRAPGPLSTGYNVLNATLRLNNGPWDISLWRWQLMDAGVGAGAAQALDPTGRQDTDLSQIDVHYRYGNDAGTWSSNVAFSYRALNDYPQFVLFPAGTTLPVGTDGNIATSPTAGLVTFPEGVFGQPAVLDRFTNLEWTSVYTGWSDHQVRVGMGIKQEQERGEELKNFGPGVINGTEGTVSGTLTDVSGTPYVFLPNMKRTVKYLSLQDEWGFAPDWALTTGLRYDDYSDFGGTLNPRLALVWSTRYDLTSKFLYGRAFRAPSFGELHAQNNPVVLGNPTLQPETIDSYEMAFDYRPTAALTTRLNLYRYVIANLIDYVPDAGGQTSTAQNAEDRNGHGLELEAEWQASHAVNLAASYSWQHSEDALTGQAVPNTPGQMASVRATWQVARLWSVAMQNYWVADMKRAAGDPRAPIKDYLLSNLTLRHRFDDKHYEIAATVYNLFNRDARAPTLYNPSLGNAAIPDDYPLPGRSLWLEMRYSN